MSQYLLLGAQWGDEGKGKLADLLAEQMDLVVRFQGGANAGHTVIVNGQKTVLHQLPSGMLHRRPRNLIGNGCVLDLVRLVREIDELRELGIPVSPDNVVISAKAHVVTPIHQWLDERKGATIGTTGRGIGPCYAEKAQRSGLRVADLFETIAATRFAEHMETLRQLFPGNSGPQPGELEKRFQAVVQAAQTLKKMVGNVQEIMVQALGRQQNILLEGAQGALLDLDHGTYPFVTSSNTTIGGAYTGTGVYLPFDLRIGVVKAYQTRVGNGPFPSELTNEIGETLRNIAGEFGATTGRPRRCGWLDLPLLQESIVVNGFNYLALTKLDCLSHLDRIGMAVGYSASGTPEIVELPGWQQDISNVRSFAELPGACQEYVRFIETRVGVPVGLVSVGPDRHQNIIRTPLC